MQTSDALAITCFGRRASESRRFVAEQLLGVYLLIVLLPNEGAEDAWIGRVLDRERKALCDIIMSLPPLDGGGRRAQSAVLKSPEQ